MKNSQVKALNKNPWDGISRFLLCLLEVQYFGWINKKAKEWNHQASLLHCAFPLSRPFHHANPSILFLSL
jgi:hypothetical protein